MTNLPKRVMLLKHHYRCDNEILPDINCCDYVNIHEKVRINVAPAKKSAYPTKTSPERSTIIMYLYALKVDMKEAPHS